MTLHYVQLCQTQLITLCVQYRFDDEVRDDAHGDFTPEMMKLPQATWIETFVEGVTDKSTGLSIFKELAWFVYKVSGVMCSASACEHCWSIEGWIHSKRRNNDHHKKRNHVHQKLVEKLVRAHTNMVLGRVWMTHSIIYYRGTWSLPSMSPFMIPKRNPKFKSTLFLFIPTSSVEGRDTYGPRELVCNTLF
jgi:hypothetical protein